MQIMNASLIGSNSPYSYPSNLERLSTADALDRDPCSICLENIQFSTASVHWTNKKWTRANQIKNELVKQDVKGVAAQRHVFHTRCLVQWSTSCQEAGNIFTCPSCREPLSPCNTSFFPFQNHFQHSRRRVQVIGRGEPESVFLGVLESSNHLYSIVQHQTELNQVRTIQQWMACQIDIRKNLVSKRLQQSNNAFQYICVLTSFVGIQLLFQPFVLYARDYATDIWLADLRTEINLCEQEIAKLEGEEENLVEQIGQDIFLQNFHERLREVNNSDSRRRSI